jgi:tRNA A37 threonylcarbamoyladenosine modification protein TsaB
LEKYLILFSSDLESSVKEKKMIKLIIDAADKVIFLMLIINNKTYSITHENSKINYEKLTILINDFLNSNNLVVKDIKKIYVNRGPGSFAGIRNSLSIVKAFKITNYLDYYGYSLEDFKDEKDLKYENVPDLCDKFKIEKNLINPNYMG